MKKKDDRWFLWHIAEALSKIERYVQSGKESFFADTLIQDAVIRNFEITGEAVKNISESMRNKYPAIDWTGMAGFRNILIHQYFGVDLETVWEITQTTAPSAKKYIESMPEYQEFLEEIKELTK